jgi:hypothetical protein
VRQTMRVSIIKPPKSVVSGKAPWQWQVGQTYDLPPSQALALIVDYCARVEMRTGRDRRKRRRPFSDERRRRQWWS